ncbi:assimilatory sulfite reductase (NADPH) flavoprotein subunit [[Pseudomonas] carboxydohydrogena]|uniref:Sulfite reductase [NADPH] flavoprotein alpha-component n=1 Tax=Afipia carboxydohydrogena TaxID=290 RepID=A0ABY8BPG1_AFICR|nr:assimilatory sulfite reductase (NADPH) flavoprotein subunit [[Pseudomonas] carboxydohydrogena]WEF51559.1 assimilatory sulfite reductase (NADPH) flavoprotein subunit [[Pseudomonas] carboxydohydrogena]
MTKPFPGPALSQDQWQQISSLATTLSPEQATWISGYFSGVSDSFRLRAGSATALAERVPVAVETAAPAAASRTLTVLYASETGNSAALAKAFAQDATAQGIHATAVSMADYKVRGLKDEQDLVVITSTHGEGDPPQASVGFFEFLESRKAPKLPQLRFAVLALGDSTYEKYCEAGKRIDRRLEELGAQRIAARVDCDVDYEEPASAWHANVLRALAPVGQASAAAPVAASSAVTPAQTAAFDKKNPYAASVIDNIVLTGRGSSKETRHIELSLADSGLTYQPGDALGIVPRNDPALVASLIEKLKLQADAPVTVKQETLPLHEALGGAFEVTAATPRFLDHWASVTGSSELERLRSPEEGAARTAFLHNHHILDIVNRFPASGIEPATLLAGLRPLQPRLYSIASSLAATPEEVHLTVSTVRYNLHDVPRAGVASGYLASLTGEDATLPVYVQPSAHFHLPANDVPIIMIGAGTGVAPYRAFMQQREAEGASGRSWLFFGERNFRSDFLYQVEWQALLKSGALSRMDVAFSRDGANKVYVQDRLREQGRDIYAWLEDGARIYVCGDATHMAPDVHKALAGVIEAHSGLSHEAANEYLNELQRDRRYLLDVY